MVLLKCGRRLHRRRQAIINTANTKNHNGLFVARVHRYFPTASALRATERNVECIHARTQNIKAERHRTRRSTVSCSVYKRSLSKRRIRPQKKLFELCNCVNCFTRLIQQSQSRCMYVYVYVCTYTLYALSWVEFIQIICVTLTACNNFSLKNIQKIGISTNTPRIIREYLP